MRYTWFARHCKRVLLYFRFRRDGVSRHQSWLLARAVWR